MGGVTWYVGAQERELLEQRQTYMMKIWKCSGNQRCGWKKVVDMRNLAERFVVVKNGVHGEDIWVLLFCDNLSAYLDQEVKTIFGNHGKVLLFYFPPNMTNFIQPIDAGHLRRSVRILIGHFLYAWLMEADHMEKWESKMTAGERRILSIGFRGTKAMQKVMT